MTVIYEHDSRPSRNRSVILGYRQPGDTNITTIVKDDIRLTYTFPNAEFEYENNSYSFTAVKFSFDVRRDEH